MRGVLAGSLGLTLVLLAGPGRAEELKWQPILGPPVAVSAADQSPAGPVPAVVLGRPVAIEPADAVAPFGAGQLRPVAYETTMPVLAPVIRAQSPDLPGPTLAVPGPAAVGAPPPSGPGSPAEQYNCGVVNQNPAPTRHFLDGPRDFFGGLFGKGKFDSDGRHHWFESDHCFDDFISPVSNPFYFEDPRALTEARPLFIYQGAPTGNPIYHGSDIEFFGVQGRVAFTNWFSLVVSKLGYIWSEVHDPIDGFNSHAGFAEINIGPKFTFLRCEGTGTIGAAGLNFVIPAGSSKVQQDTGSLTLEPYVSFGQRFGRTKYGTFHALSTLGFNASTDNERTNNFFTSLHIDFDYADAHKIYPLLELNYFHYTDNGRARDFQVNGQDIFTFEGRDLYNFGSRNVAGHDDLSIAVGARYKLNENIQFGAVAEFPLIEEHKDLMDFRLTFDVIFRY
jgi:hypothetical protein